MKNRIAMLALTCVAWLLMATSGANGCLWDRNTLGHEARGQDEAINAIIGWFDRNPPLFYEMRIKIAAAAIEKNADDLGAYDDAGVACDRLGRGDEALKWMERKLVRLERMNVDDPTVRDHRYRYLANTGTFWVHRWARNGADRTKLAEVEKARDFIAAAIALNPQAHFGREKYQLKFLEWIITPPFSEATTRPASTSPSDLSSTQPSGPGTFSLDAVGLARAIVGGTRDDLLSIHQIEFNWNHLSRQVPFDGPKSLAGLGYADAEQGLAGLVILGNGWESIDVYVSLWMVLSAQQRWKVCTLVQCRMEELLHAGKGTLSPDFSSREQLREWLIDNLFKHNPVADVDEIRETYKSARRAADARHAAREKFMLERLQAGRHPDTDARFWDGYREPKRPVLPGQGVIDRITSSLGREGTAIVGFAVMTWLLAMGLLVFRKVRKRRQALQFTQSENP